MKIIIKSVVVGFLGCLVFSIHGKTAVQEEKAESDFKQGLALGDFVPIRMGIELELQGTIYKKPEHIIFQDHIRLFESQEKSSINGDPLWYLEVDGSGNLEFVTEPFDINRESSTLKLCLNNIKTLSLFLLQNSKFNYREAIVSIKSGTKLRDIGEFVHKSILADGNLKNIDEIIVVDIKAPFFPVRPQATFQIPLSLVRQFSEKMAFKHVKLFKEVSNLKDFKVETPGDGLSYLAVLYSQLLSNHHSPSELGPKGVLTLMSRGSFSGMYKKLDPAEKEKFQKNLQTFLDLNGKKKLFFKPYSLFYGIDLCSGQINKKEISSLIQSINSITIGDFFTSIINPEIFKDVIKSNKEMFIRALISLSGIGGVIPEIVLEEISNIEAGLFDYQGTDIISPPPFLRHSYAMGKYKEIEKDVAVLEMRGYAAAYIDSIEMNELVNLWLEREMNGAMDIWSKIQLIEPFRDTVQKLKNTRELKLKPFLNLEKALSVVASGFGDFLRISSRVRAVGEEGALIDMNPFEAVREGVEKTLEEIRSANKHNYEDITKAYIQYSSDVLS